jgi:SAM-dependent methyltransferase
MWFFLAIAVLSAAAIGYEVLLMRLFSIVQWHHFAYLIISLALLGYGASGTLLALTQPWLLPRFASVFISSAVLFGLTAVGSFVLAQRVPFNPLEVIWDVHQWLYLLLLYLLCCVPFFCAATCIGLALARFKAHIGRIYQADLLGAGCGALGIVLALFVLPPTVCLTLLGALGFLAAALASLDRTLSRPRWLALALLLGGLVLPGAWPQDWVTLRLSAYKGLSQTLRVPGTEVVSERSSPLGILTVVRSPTIPFRYAPDLSLNNTVEPPPQLGLFTDGDSLSVITRYDGQRAPLAYLDFLPSALPYYLLTHPRVLILGAGGGMDVLQARYHQARAIDAVELNPQVIDLVQRQHAEFAGQLYNAPDVRLHIAEARGFVATSRMHYDLIQLALLDSFSASAAGVHALNESYLYTVEALQAYLSHLRPGGILAITRWLKLPPRDSLKLFATALLALERSGTTHPARQLALIRGWQTSTLLVKRGELTAADITAIRAFCDARAFDVAYYPGIPATVANRYNVLESPYVFEGAMALVSNNRNDFLRRYKYDITPATDNRPYFFHFFKWRVLPEMLALRGQGGLPLLEWGYLILIAALLQAIVVSVVLILLPLRWLRPQTGRRWQRHRIGWYFAALGLAFLCIEMAFMQRFILFLSHPLYAIAVVLCAFLVFAGLGSGYAARLTQGSQGLPPRHEGKAIALAIGGIVILALVYLWLLGPLLQWGLWLPNPVKIALTLACIAPLAFCMGLPFPLGLVCVSRQVPAMVPWAWGINGCTSVLSAILAIVLAMHYGFTVVVGLALVLYGLAALALYGPLEMAQGKNME